MLNQLKKDLEKLRNPKKAKILQRFFKTGKGEYGEGDIFLGIVVPTQRLVAKKYTELTLKDLQKLLSEKVHEYRLIALIILIQKYKKASIKAKKEIVAFYLKNTKKINNWDLVDISCRDILGNFLLDKHRAILYKLAKSKNIWKRRIAIISTFEFIKHGQLEDTLRISEMLLKDSHDLIHKAVGWMLRELGKKNRSLEEEFLEKHYIDMPRTMLRYAIEKFEEKKRKHYLQ